MLKFKVLYSGSSGNCVLIYSKNTKILVDIGKSSKFISLDLMRLNLSVRDIDAVLITHEHQDHIKGVNTFEKYFFCNIYFLEDCYKEIIKKSKISPLRNSKKIIENFKIKDINITSFKTSHDSVDSCGFVFESDGYRLAYVTDLGEFTDIVYNNIKGCNYIIIESNYDEDILKLSKYPNFLKRRISSNKGHLSNKQCADAVEKLVESGTYNYTLAHISQNNNLDILALETIRSRFIGSSILKDLNINLSLQDFKKTLKDKKDIKL